MCFYQALYKSPLWVVTKGFERNQGCFNKFCFWGMLLEVFKASEVASNHHYM